MSFFIPAILLGSFVLSLVLTAAVRSIAPRFNFVDKPGHRKIHHVPKPLGGGIAIFWSIALPILAGLAYVNYFDPPALSVGPAPAGSTVSTTSFVRQNALSAHWPGIRHQTPLALKVLLAAFLMHVMGIWDDRKAMGPYTKLVIQLAITAGLIVWADVRALTFLDNYGLGIWPSVALTVLWIAGITNAFNFLDNMDGLSAGVAAVCSCAFLITTMTMPAPQWFVATMLALLIGALAGFLCFNFNPASIFMGDSGSLVLGLLLGTLTIRTTYLTGNLAQGWYAVFAPLIVLAVPLYDLVVVSAIRIRRGKSPFVGDTNHFSHRLVARGMSRRTAVLCIWLITAATSVAAIILPHVHSTFLAVLIFLQTLLILGVVMLLEQHPLPAEVEANGTGRGA